MLARPTLDAVAALVPVVREAALESGAIASRFFRRGRQTSAKLWHKDKGSPVTEADVAVDTFLKVRLSEVLPEAGWLSEETADNPERLGRDLVWIVDPIDGTRAFVGGHPDWSVCIALLAKDRPVLGVVYAPAHDLIYEALAGEGARRNGAAMAVSARPEIGGGRFAGPKPLIDTFARRLGHPVATVPKIPSLALRLVRVAEGSVDVGLVSANSRDWDLAAADLILHEAGGLITDLHGAPLRYNRPEPVHGELAAASARLHPGVIAAMRADEGAAHPPR
ncbi:MAG TPA: 3'(2'),5'-bisphosphate nucleotidase CysQ [Microvirga sp.]|jgi:myo-inositol-1(or 4)-monophosphatase|nr:3'(2'),5'-bisphosphate nucleotidase CysQ [Microvirga sp.]